MKKYIVVKEEDTVNFEMMLDGLSEQGFEIETSTIISGHNGHNIYYALMSKVIE